MALLALLFGSLMIGLGLLGYYEPSLFGTFEKVSMTSLIPAYIGIILVLCACVTLAQPAARKHAMHLAAVAGVVGFLGGFMPVFRSNFDFNKASAVTGMLLSGLALIFVILCVKSFIDARRLRQQA